MNKQYWENFTLSNMEKGVARDLHTRLAWELIAHFGSVAADEAGEDSQGRSKLRLQSPNELIERCFAIADAFVAKAEARGGIREVIATEEEVFKRAGELEHIKSNAAWGKVKTESIPK